jgi:RnfABCDGE-type electron transport complex D subunit
MKFLKTILDRSKKFIKKTPFLKRFYPVLEATDEFFFGTDKTTLIAPYILDWIDIKRYMSLVIIALIPSAIAGIYFYGLRVIIVIFISYIFGGLTEVLFSIGRRKPLYEGFLVTGLIFPLILPPTIPLWMVAVGIVFGVFFGKEVFGGTGRNIFNPALVGRVFLSMAFPKYFSAMWQKPFINGLGGFTHYASDAITSATPLINFKTSHIFANYSSLIFGTTGGSIGETFRLGIILGGLFLMIMKISDWRIPFSYILSVLVFSFFAHNFLSDKFAPPLFQILSGGLLFGAFFMAPDPVTSPLTFEGKWVYGILLGIITVLIRALSGFVEGVMFAILIMNALNPFIDNLITNIKFRNIIIRR